MNLSQSKMENAQSHVITVTGKIIKVYKLSREHNVTPLPCFWVFFFFFFYSQTNNRVHQQGEYSQSSKRESISSQLGRSCGSAQQSAK
jgi:hypothetical protein